jgi:NhaP-type Na+/H+ or K+/H+ antiporter
MTGALWFLVVGVLLVGMVAAGTVVRRLPLTTALLYLVVGVALGPAGAGLITLDAVRDAALLERLAEVAVLVSLFGAGLKLRTTLSDRRWHLPVRLATLSMVVTVALVTAIGVRLLGLPLGAAVLLGAILAPTDPVLASDVQVAHPTDQDRLRFALTGEAGLNDGAAFPFVMLALGLLGLHELGTLAWRWWTVDVLWATAGGLLIGWCLGVAFSRGVLFLRREKEQALGMESFFTLGLIALSYGLALKLHAYGFLSVFASGVAMQHIERGHRRQQRRAVGANGAAEVAPAVLAFTLDLERIAELALMLVIGSLLRLSAFTAQTLAVALCLICVVRPLAVVLSTRRADWAGRQRLLAAWFGIRGIGSMYYLSFAFAHGAYSAEAQFVADAVLVTIALSVLLHGSSATPLMRLYARARSWRRRR